VASLIEELLSWKLLPLVKDEFTSVELLTLEGELESVSLLFECSSEEKLVDDEVLPSVELEGLALPFPDQSMELLLEGSVAFA
jgi:hypothetical protein